MQCDVFPYDSHRGKTGTGQEIGTGLSPAQWIAWQREKSTHLNCTQNGEWLIEPTPSGVDYRVSVVTTSIHES
jgi:hypothetical protein